MSESANCSICGQRYGASWGNVSGLCPNCANGDTPKKIQSENAELIKKNQELRATIKAMEPPTSIGKNI